MHNSFYSFGLVPRARASQTCTKERALRACTGGPTGSVCRKTMNGSAVPLHIDWYAGALRKALLCGPFPLGCGAAGRRCRVVALRWLAFGVGEAGSRQRRPSAAENKLSGRGPSPSRKAGVQVSQVRGSWSAAISGLTQFTRASRMDSAQRSAA